MKKMRVPRAGGNFELIEERVAEPDAGYARVKVQACGICHSDALTKEGGWPGIVYPRSPGHEIASVIDALGDRTHPWQVGDRIGIGWHGGHCGRCESCRRGDFITCAKLQIPGISYDGGYAEFVFAPIEALARIPADLAPEEAAPLMCAGITMFNALRNSGARPGDLVAIQGIGGLGHLGIQFAAKFGFETVAIGRGIDKKSLALKLGARSYIDAMSQDAAKELAGLGGARAILATAPDGRAMGSLIDGLGVDRKLVIVGASAEPFAVSSLPLLMARKSVSGWPSGTSADSEDTLKFAAATGVRAMIESFPSVSTIRDLQYRHGADAQHVSPDGYTLDIAYMARPGAEEIQLDLILDYRSNVALYPVFQEYFRLHRPPMLAIWGKNDPFFLPAGAEAYRRDIPDAEVRFLDTGHFALETHAAEIAVAIRSFLERSVAEHTASH
jgi:D-arabinose 1-dehydrogenase-like Zn-dependent alcohol dehydrogenase